MVMAVSGTASSPQDLPCPTNTLRQMGGTSISMHKEGYEPYFDLRLALREAYRIINDALKKGGEGKIEKGIFSPS